MTEKTDAKTDQLTELPADEIANRLDSAPGWQTVDDGDAIRRTWKLPSFPAALAFVQFAGQVAEAHDHHPDIDIRYSKVTLTISTHSIGGKLTEKDFAFARALSGR